MTTPDLQAYDGISRMRMINPLDVLTLCEAYGMRAIGDIRNGYAKPEHVYENARRAFHHALTFTHLDASYTTRWEEAR